MVVQIRGTSGSGKSWAIHQLLREELGAWEPQFVSKWVKSNRRIPLWYKHKEKPIAVCGSYTSLCGGCDNVGSAKYVYQLYEKIRMQYPNHTLLSEGLLLSEDVKWTTIYTTEKGWDVRPIFLTTDADVCIERVNKRRAYKGKHPVDETNTRGRIAVIERAKVKLEEKGVDCWSLTALETPSTILEWINAD